MTSGNMEDRTLCKDIHLSDLMDFKSAESAQRLEKAVCSLNMSTIMKSFSKTDMYAMGVNMVGSTLRHTLGAAKWHSR